ncbi:MAG TPA: glycosyltransferase family 2 protein [Actinomycetota bacterium]|nr:glycosyltransferase family 2 protein [Actinomycetota bacterium]
MGWLAARLVVLAATLYFLLERRLFGPSGLTIGVAVGVFILGKAVLALVYKPRISSRTRYLKVALVVPFYEESDTSLGRTLHSIIQQTRPVDHLIVVNDGSSMGEGAVRLWLGPLRSRINKVTYQVFPKNGGKREALAWAFRNTDCDIVITTDSDTGLSRATVANLVKPFASPEVQAVTGRVAVRNRKRNLLTRFQHIIYAAAFMNQRAAQSNFGTVLICSGAVAAYRRTTIEQHLHEFLENKWMFGEDRHLASFALLHGKVVYQESAVASTDVPERVPHYMRQQLRWQRGFVQNTLWTLANFPLSHRSFWLCFLQMATGLALLAGVVYALISAGPDWGKILIYSFLTYALLISYALHARYQELKSDEGIVERLLMFAFTPVFGLGHFIFIVPIRTYALLSYRNKGWGSRRRTPSGFASRP